MTAPVTVRRVVSKAEKKAFVELAYRLNAGDPNWVPPLKDEVRGLITPGKNPWFEHAEAAFFLAWRAGAALPVGRISAQIDALVLEHMGPGIGQWGMFEAEDEAVAHALLAAAEDWLAAKGMARSMGPFSLSIWDEPGLLVEGHDHPPMVMMGHNNADYRRLGRAGRLRQGQGPLQLRSPHRRIPAADRAHHRGRREESAHPHPQGRPEKVRRGSGLDPRHRERRLVGQLGLHPIDPGRERLCRPEAEADRARRDHPRRRARWRAGRVHAVAARHQRADPRPRRRAVPVRMGEIAVAPAAARTIMAAASP